MRALQHGVARAAPGLRVVPGARAPRACDARRMDRRAAVGLSPFGRAGRTTDVGAYLLADAWQPPASRHVVVIDGDARTWRVVDAARARSPNTRAHWQPAPADDAMGGAFISRATCAPGARWCAWSTGIRPIRGATCRARRWSPSSPARTSRRSAGWSATGAPGRPGGRGSRRREVGRSVELRGTCPQRRRPDVALAPVTRRHGRTPARVLWCLACATGLR